MSDPRECTCHPDDKPPVPCAKQYALLDCLRERIAALEKELLTEQILHNSAKKLSFTFSEIIIDQSTAIADYLGEGNE